MEKIILKNKPLVEAIFEYRWELVPGPEGMKVFPHYDVLIGSLYEKIKNDYPFHQDLLSANIPSSMVEYIPQHRFRKGKNEHPLVQLGPGILTVNDAVGYVWEDFKPRIVKTIQALFDAYPDDKRSLEPSRLDLRYIDAIKFDFENENILDFLRKNMKLDLGIGPALFEDTGIGNAPKGLDLKLGFECATPNGAFKIRLRRGIFNKLDALIWETTVTSVKEMGLPKIPEEIGIWLEQSHDITHKWFFRLIEGNLMGQFR